MRLRLMLAMAGVLLACSARAVQFDAAEPIWTTAEKGEVNSSVAFTTHFEWDGKAPLKLRLAGCSVFKVFVNGAQTKSSREIKAGDSIEVRKGAIHYSYTVIEPVDKRQGAKFVDQYAENTTPQSELDKLIAPVETIFLKRERGSGRPTKKERRDIDRLMDGF